MPTYLGRVSETAGVSSNFYGGLTSLWRVRRKKVSYGRAAPLARSAPSSLPSPFFVLSCAQATLAENMPGKFRSWLLTIFDEMVLECLPTIPNLKPPSHAVKQAFLYMAMGGLGIRNMSRPADICYASSLSLTTSLMKPITLRSR